MSPPETTHTGEEPGIPAPPSPAELEALRQLQRVYQADLDFARRSLNVDTVFAEVLFIAALVAGIAAGVATGRWLVGAACSLVFSLLSIYISSSITSSLVLPLARWSWNRAKRRIADIERQHAITHARSYELLSASRAGPDGADRLDWSNFIHAVWDVSTPYVVEVSSASPASIGPPAAAPVRATSVETELDAIKGGLKAVTGDTAMLFLARCIPDFQAGRYDAAMREVEAGLAENPDHPRLLVFAGMIRFQEVRYGEAINLFRRVLSVDPGNETARNMLGCKELAEFADENAS